MVDFLSFGLTYLIPIGTLVCCLCARTSWGAWGKIYVHLLNSHVSSRGMHARWCVLFFLPALLPPLDHQIVWQGCFWCERRRCYRTGMLGLENVTTFLLLTAVTFERCLVNVPNQHVLCSILYCYLVRMSLSTRVARHCPKYLDLWRALFRLCLASMFQLSREVMFNKILFMDLAPSFC